MIRPSSLKPLPDHSQHDAAPHIHQPIFPTVEFRAPQRSWWCWRTEDTYSRSLLSRLMTEMPIDILLEILGHLTPADLLMLSRTTKALRALLMRRSSISVWRMSIANVPGLPVCPPDLTEPQYANLAFDDHCHFCLKSDVYNIFWGCRLRACRKCIQKYFISDHDLRKRFPHEPGDNRYNAIFPYIVYPKPRPFKPGRVLYHLSMAECYFRELADIKTDEDLVESWGLVKKEQQYQRLSHAGLCELWSRRWMRKRSFEIDVVVAFPLLILLMLFASRYLVPFTPM